MDIFWKKKVSVARFIMRRLERNYVEHKKLTHSDLILVTLFCDSFNTHIDTDVDTLFGEGGVLLLYFPPMTNFIQPIDAGLGRSVGLYIGKSLDFWLMEVENVEKWEDNMTAGDFKFC